MKRSDQSARFDEASARHWLAERGLPLYAALSVVTLPVSLEESLAAAGIVRADGGSLLLFGNAGASFWPVFSAHRPASANPVDDYSRRIALEFAREQLGDSAARCLFPDADVILPLQQLGRLAGWGQPSPLGMALHPEFGLWSAYRAVLYTECNLPASRLQPVESACVDCAAPCVSACPAGALSQQEMPDARECLGYRITADSVCADRCVARLACPVAEAHHYPLAQIQHHYADPLTTWRRYFAE